LSNDAALTFDTVTPI